MSHPQPFVIRRVFYVFQNMMDGIYGAVLQKVELDGFGVGWAEMGSGVMGLVGSSCLGVVYGFEVYWCS